VNQRDKRNNAYAYGRERDYAARDSRLRSQREISCWFTSAITSHATPEVLRSVAAHMRVPRLPTIAYRHRDVVRRLVPSRPLSSRLVRRVRSPPHSPLNTRLTLDPRADRVVRERVCSRNF